jgi:tripartite-type tricarboxylate transporter receptor subunit TctC
MSIAARVLARAARAWQTALESHMMRIHSPVAASMLSMALAALAGPVAAQAWPTKPVTLVVNIPPGSSADVIARAVAGPLQSALGQPFIVDNRAGAAGNIGAEVVARAAADGHTLLMSPASIFTINPSVYPKLPFDPVKDFIPITATAYVTSFLVVRPNLPASNYAQFVEWVKSEGGKVNYASPGAGSVPHLAAEVFLGKTALAASHVPYRGSSLALQDVMAAQVDFTFDPGIAVSAIKGNKVKLLAVGTPKRSGIFPNVPTLDELGVKGFDASTTIGLYAPAGVPAEVVGKINTALRNALAQPAVREQIIAMGAEPTATSPSQFSALIRDEAQRSAAVVKERRLSIE